MLTRCEGFGGSVTRMAVAVGFGNKHGRACEQHPGSETGEKSTLSTWSGLGGEDWDSSLLNKKGAPRSPSGRSDVPSNG